MPHEGKKRVTLLWILAASSVFWGFFSETSILLSIGLFLVWVAVMTLVYYEATEKEKQFLASYGYTLGTVCILWHILIFFFTGDGICMVQSTTSMVIFYYATAGDAHRGLFRGSYRLSFVDIVYGVTGIIGVYIISHSSLLSLADYFFLATVLLLLIVLSIGIQGKKLPYLKKSIGFWIFFGFWLSTLSLLLVERYIGI